MGFVAYKVSIGLVSSQYRSFHTVFMYLFINVLTTV